MIKSILLVNPNITMQFFGFSKEDNIFLQNSIYKIRCNHLNIIN